MPEKNTRTVVTFGTFDVFHVVYLPRTASISTTEIIEVIRTTDPVAMPRSRTSLSR